MTELAISQIPEDETLLEWIVGDALRFWLTIEDPNPDYDPDLPEDPDTNPQMKPRDLTGWSVAAQIRKSTKLADPVLAVFEFNILDETGEIAAYLTPEESTKLDGVRAGRWDLQLTDPSGDPETIMYGPAAPAGQVTRDE